MAELAGWPTSSRSAPTCVLDLDLLTLLRARTRPLLFTCRSASEGGALAGRRPAAPAHAAGGRQARLRLRGRRVRQRLHGRDDARRRDAAWSSPTTTSTGTPDDLDASTRDMCERGRRHREDRGDAALDRRRGPAARASPRAWPRAGGTPAHRLAMGPLGMHHARAGRPLRRALHLRRRRRAGAEAAPGQLPAAQMADLYRVRDGRPPATRVYGVLGRDVTRSLSPVLHNRAFAARGLDAVYVPLQAEALDAFLRGAARARPRRLQRDAALQGRDPAATCTRWRRRRPPAAASTPWSCDDGRCAAPPPTASACWAPAQAHRR